MGGGVNHLEKAKSALESARPIVAHQLQYERNTGDDLIQRLRVEDCETTLGKIDEALDAITEEMLP